MIWFILLLFLLVGFFALLGVSYIKDRQFLKKSTGETMDQRFREKIDHEDTEERRRRGKFEESLKKYGN